MNATTHQHTWRKVNGERICWDCWTSQEEDQADQWENQRTEEEKSLLYCASFPVESVSAVDARMGFLAYLYDQELIRA